MCFFFQAEDGIRDIGVTGVQTCALPISDRLLVMQNAYLSVISPEGCAAILWRTAVAAPTAARAMRLGAAHLRASGIATSVVRSEERRVGKECRSRWSPYH